MTIKKVRAIVYDIKDNKPYFLILHRILRWKGWEILKETIEKGENPEKALLRGIKEETKLRKFKIIRKLDKKEKWQAKGINYSIVKTYLVKADMNEKISLKQEIVEHDKYQWVNKKTAIRKLTWPKTKNLLKNLNPAILFKE
jgi:ADP-ribose pyrophosphatase YjhB (NUDIX family)